MPKDASADKVAKRKRSKSITNKSKEIVEDSEQSDNEITDYGNGFEETLAVNDESSSDEGWNSDYDQELVGKIKAIAKPNDKTNYKTKLKNLNWSDIAFKNFTGEDCKKRFNVHLKQVRRHRTLNEITADIEANIKKCPVKKPLNSYQIYVQDQLLNATHQGDFTEKMRNLAIRYKELTTEERAVYERKADQLREEYKTKKREFMVSGTITTTKTKTSKNSSSTKQKTPFQLFVESQPSESDYNTLRGEYANLSIDKKYNWIVKAVSLAPEANVTTFLNKEEQRIFKGQLKSIPSPYTLFVKEMFSKIKEDSQDDDIKSKDIIREIAQRWKSLSEKHRKKYINEAAEIRKAAEKEQDEFNKRHGVSPKKMQRRKSVYIEPTPDDEEEPSPKKRKVSTSSAVDSSSDERKTKQIQIQQRSPVKVPMVSIPAPVVQPPVKSEKKKNDKRLNSTSESSDFNDRVESESSTSTSTSSKKKSKKEKKEKKEKAIEPPGGKPPSSMFKYFAKCVHTGKPRKVQKAFDRLSKQERSELKTEYNEKVQDYVNKLKTYLSSLSKDEALAYIAKTKEQESDDEAENDNNETSSQEY